MSQPFDTPYADHSTPQEPSWSTRLDTQLNRFLRPGTRDWAAACHLAPLIATAAPIPGLGALIALAVWHHKRGVEPGVIDHGREALNFQINLAFWSAMGISLFLVPWILIQIVAVSVSLVAGITTLRGDEVRYPYILRPVS
ncbi:MAG: putative Tic20 family protein [Chlamydiales bacterium]|jgi:uncharacterized Tic20 family protein